MWPYHNLQYTLDNCEILNDTFSLSIDKFASLMWNDTDFRQKMMKHSNQYDFSLVKKDDDGLIYCSKLKMLNFDVPIFNIPSFCEQQTHLTFHRDEGELVIDSVTKG